MKAEKVRTASAPLPAPAFAPGWHPGLSLDYPRDFGAHSGDAQSFSQTSPRKIFANKPFGLVYNRVAAIM